LSVDEDPGAHSQGKGFVHLRPDREFELGTLLS
jgi:hypothetical protein